MVEPIRRYPRGIVIDLTYLRSTESLVLDSRVCLQVSLVVLFLYVKKSWHQSSTYTDR